MLTLPGLTMHNLNALSFPIPQRAVERRIPLPSQRGAKPDQERNEINGRGPPPAGRMPFMSDSTLIRRSAALRKALPVTPQGIARCPDSCCPERGHFFAA